MKTGREKEDGCGLVDWWMVDLEAVELVEELGL